MAHPDPHRVDWQGIVVTVALVGVVSIAAVTGGAFVPGPRGVLAALLGVVLLAAAALRPWPLRGEDVGLLAVVGWGAVVATAGGLAPLASKEVLTAWLVAWALWAAARGAGDRARELGLWVLGGTGALLSLGFGAEYVGYRLPRVGGLLENPNVAAALVVPTAAAILLARDGRTSWGRLGLAGWMVLGVMLTGSRAALVAVLAAGTVMLPRGRPRVWASLVGICLVVVGLGWRLSAVPDPLAWHRLAIWRAVLQLVAGHPVGGVGPGCLATAARAVRIPHPDLFGVYQRMIGSAESTPLGLVAATGAVGALMVVATAWWWFRSGRAASLGSSPRARGTVAAMLGFALVHDLTGLEIDLWWWALLLGLLEPATDAGRHTPRQPARLAMGAALLWFVLWGLTQPAYARWLWTSRGPSTALAERLLLVEPWLARPAEWSTEQLLGRSRWTWGEAAEALAWAERAVRAEPGQARLWANLGRVHARTISELAWSEASVEAGRRAYGRATELEPRLPWYWAERAELERSLGQLEGAASLARRSVALEPRFVGGHLLLARLELDLGRVEAARASLQAAQEIRTSARGRRLTGYERGLVAAPPWQLELLSEALQ